MILIFAYGICFYFMNKAKWAYGKVTLCLSAVFDIFFSKIFKV
jgi:hypothetical protein